MFESFFDFLYHGFLGKFLGLNALQAPLFWTLTVAGFVLSIAVPYLLGSLNFAVIVSSKKYHDDIRRHGSGNGGMTNMLRTYGKGAAGLTLLGDVGKAFISVIFGYLFFGYLTAYIAALFCMLGHMFPCYYHFRGGKGVLVTAAAALLLDPLSALICFLIFAIIVLGTKYVSLGSVMTAIFYPLVLNRMAALFSNTAVQGLPNLIAIIMALLIVFMHRANIKRLLNGEESKLSLGKKKNASSED